MTNVRMKPGLERLSESLLQEGTEISLELAGVTFSVNKKQKRSNRIHSERKRHLFLVTDWIWKQT